MNKLVLVLGMATVAAGGLIACGGGGSNANLCTVPADCTDTALPYCVAGVCHACESPTNCNAAAPVCEAEVFECGGCVNDASCGAYPATSHCAPSGACVGCVTSDQCSGTTPVCDTGPGTCRACSLDSECASGACNLESGACIAEASILYAAPTGTPNTMCTRAMPCTVKQALNIVNTAKSTVVLADGDYNFNSGTTATLSASKSALVVGSKVAKLSSSASAPAITVSGGASLVLRGITLSATMRPTIECAAAVLRVSSIVASGGLFTPLFHLADCQTTVFQSTFEGNAILSDYVNGPTGRSTLTVAGNTFNIAADNELPLIIRFDDGSATVTNNLFFNRTPAGCAPCGLVALYSAPNFPGTKIFAYNTIVGGVTSTSSNSPQTGTTLVQGNIYSAPNQSGLDFGGTFKDDLFNLKSMYLDFGAGVIDGDPKFVNAAAGDFHLMPDSPAIDKGPTGVPTGLPTKDLDGNARLVGAATDMGAFEFHP